MTGQKLQAEDQPKINKIPVSRRIADSIDDDEYCWNPCNRVKIGVMSGKKSQKNRTAKTEHRCRNHCARTTDKDLPAENICAKRQQVQMNK